MNYSLEKICQICDGSFLQQKDNGNIKFIFFDSRKIIFAEGAIFLAIKGVNRDGHQFVDELYQRGVKNFIVSEKINYATLIGANIIKVKNSVAALQLLAIHHREQFDKKNPIIGITGSNGKTIVKEWLYQLLNENYSIVRSPKSYNSQIGVPLSVLEIEQEHNIGIFEAGISKSGEMDQLRKIIQPDIGILTNIGEAHSEGFPSIENKVDEKIKLFDSASVVIYCNNEWLADKAIVLKHETSFHKTGKYPFQIFSWGELKKSTLQIVKISKGHQETLIIAFYKNSEINICIPFTDDASIHNAITCWCVLLYLDMSYEKVEKRMKLLQPISMRLELKKGINYCTLINDSYSADLSSLRIALNFLQQQNLNKKKTVILSDFFQSGMDNAELYKHIAAELVQHKINRVVGIGLKISEYLQFDSVDTNTKIATEFYPSTENFKSNFRVSEFKEETILIKGARIFKFEKICQLLEQKVHYTELGINLNAVIQNFKEYQKLLTPSTKVMAMVKAFAYGSGGVEIATTLQYQKVDYFGVAYADEGAELRNGGIALPIMVLNPDENAFEIIVENNLEPTIYSVSVLNSFQKYLNKAGINHYPIHLEIETGMNRLGLTTAEVKKLCVEIKSSNCFKIQSIFSHLASSENKLEDEFTIQQKDKFLKAATQIEKEIGYSIIKHISNSAAIVRHPELQLDMVRLGIGLYGVDNSGLNQLNLEPVTTLKSNIAQLKHVKKGESVGYGRKGVVIKDSIIATARIGYADGFSRNFGNGVGKMWVKGKLAPVIGMVCMDMTMIDVTAIPDVKEGDSVIIFGKELPIEIIAKWIHTIPYEIMTGISQRVKRVYYQE